MARVLRKGAWILITFFLLGIAGGALLTLLATPTYQVTSTLYVTIRGGTTTGDLQAGNVYIMQKAPTFAALATTDSVLERAIARLSDGTTVGQLRGSVTVTARANSGIIDVFGGGDSARVTAARANAVASALAETIKGSGEQPATTTSSRNANRLTVDASVVEPASVPQVAVAPQPRYNLFAGAVAGLAVGVAILVVRHALDSRVYTLADLPADRSLLSRTSIPPRSSRGPRSELDAPQLESFRALRSGMQFGTDFPRSIAVAGVGAEADAGFVTDHLANVMAEVGMRVIVVDADLRNGLARKRGEEDRQQPGLTQVLAGSTSMQDAIRARASSDPTIVRMPPGRTATDSTQLLSTPAMRELVQQLERTYELVLIKCPPVAERADALAVAALTATTLLVVQGGATKRSPLRFALGLLAGVKARSVGVVLKNGYPA